ncbi:MAG TPA: DUF2254 domain-containing protein, partial [Candidatus Contendobacter sp.]|nr:DUF2254 domain-containing protein [Candidatus Contendobacter sp.]
LKTHTLDIPLWLIPMLYVGVTTICGLTLPRLEQEYLAAYSHGMSVASAQATLSAIASGMMALTGIVFALAFVMVQFSAIAYSPRLVVWFGRDPVLFHSLGLFTATFVYAIATLAWVDRGGSGKAPLFSVLLVTVLLILSMIVFAKLVQRLNDLQITNVLHFIGQQGREVIRAMFPYLGTTGDAAPESWQTADEAIQQRPITQTLRYSGEPVTLTRFHIGALVRQAQAADALIVMECAVGDTLTEDTLLLRVHGGRALLAEIPLRQAIQTARERTFEQDPKYPLRLLVDIAIKALSPAINDPTTAVQALDQIEDLLHRLGRRALDAGCVKDDRGDLRLIFPTPTWEDYLTLAFDEIRQYGVSSVQVMRRLRSALLGLMDSVTEAERKEVVRRYLHHLNLVVERSVLDAEDQAMALQEDRQGLGLSRRRAER